MVAVSLLARAHALATTPAASSSAATFGAACVRGCGRDAISVRRPPTPMPAMSSGETATPARTRWSTQSKPFSFGLRAQPGAPIAGAPSSVAEDEQVARIDRHAEARRPPAGGADRGGHDVVAVDHRRGAEDDQELGASRLSAGERGGNRAGVVGDRGPRESRGARLGRSRASRSRRVLSITDALSARQHGRDQPDAERAERRDAERSRHRFGGRPASRAARRTG